MAKPALKITHLTTGMTITQDLLRQPEALTEEERARFQRATDQLEQAREAAIRRGEIDPEALDDDSGLAEEDRAFFDRLTDTGEWVGEVTIADENGVVIDRYRITRDGRRIDTIRRR
ncbi:MAG: hypothetical protein D6811_05085 [Alphaproteobacteria bacterium]|nr:MAG: hypothetical protein D6811_05085 [Alphaproteobacteria bacterium]